MTYRDFYRHVRQVFETYWTATPWVMANESSEPPVQPAGAGGSGYPKAWVDVEIDYDEASFLTYEDSEVNGFLRLIWWVEPGAGEDHIHDLFDALRAVVANHGDVTGGVDFFEPRLGNGIVLEDLPWYGRETYVPFKLYLPR